MFLLAWPNVDSACVTVLDSKGSCKDTSAVSTQRLQQQLSTIYTDALEEESVPHTSTYLKLAKSFLSLTLSSKYQHLPYKIPCNDFPFWLPTASPDTPCSLSRLCPVLCSFCLFATSYSSRLLPPPQAVNPFPHFPSASNDLIPPPSPPHFLPSVFFIFPFYLSPLLENSPLPLLSPYQASITKEIKLRKIKHFPANLFCFFLFSHFFFSLQRYTHDDSGFTYCVICADQIQIVRCQGQRPCIAFYL